MLSITSAFAVEKAILWRDPGPIATLDMASGAGGVALTPQPPFVFQEEELGGTAPKIIVRDANKRTWSVKFGEEARAEVLASRLVWAAGYFAEPSYLVRAANIDSVGSLNRAAEFVDRSQNNLIRNARFELRDPLAYKFLPNSAWDLDDKKLGDLREINGLKLLLMLVSNWDVKTSNTAVVEVNGGRHYVITDWGASMGKTGDITSRSKWDCNGYAKQSEKFIDGVENGFVDFNYDGKRGSVVSNGIRIEDVKWFADRMIGITDAQLRIAAESSGANPEEATCYVNAIRHRLTQLANAGNGSLGTSERGQTRTRTVIKTKTERAQ